MRIVLFPFLIFCFFAAIGCHTSSEPSTSTAGEGAYFPLASFIDSLAGILDQQQPVVRKRVLFRGQQTDSVQFIEDWHKELLLFSGADINKPVLEGQYEVISNRDGEQETTTYQASSTSLSIRKIIIHTISGKVSTVEVWQTDDNPVFYTNKKMRLALANGKLDHYSIEGTQKLLLNDSLHFSVEAEVLADAQHHIKPKS